MPPKLTPEQKAIYFQAGKTGETIIRAPGSIGGQQFIGDGLTDCTVRVLDHCAQVTLDDITRCNVIIGPCEDSVFVRNAIDCEIHAVCRQLRTRDCVGCKFFLYVVTDPVIETTHSCTIGEWHTTWPGLDAQCQAARIDLTAPNLFEKVYDFTPDEDKWQADAIAKWQPLPHWTKAPSIPERLLAAPDGDFVGSSTNGANADSGDAPAFKYKCVTPKQLAIKLNPPQLVLDCIVVEPVGLQSPRRLPIYQLHQLAKIRALAPDWSEGETNAMIESVAGPRSAREDAARWEPT